jgi:hypothetical protein
MKTQLKQVFVSSSILLAAAASTYMVGCSKVSFSAAPQSCGSGCSYVTTNGNFDYDYTVKASKADILFVVDNSASMSPLQSQLASKFSSFTSQLSGIDYQIGVTTTDVSSNTTPYSGQSPTPISGQLVTFSNGSNILKGSSNDFSMFTTAVARQETLNCQNYIYNYNCTATSCTGPQYATYCPSEDTRALYAANLALTVNGGAGLFRDASVPLNVVILSNADERGAGGISGYPQLEQSDEAQTLISNVQSIYPGKQLKIHSIVIKPGDTSCYSNQDQRNKNPARDLFGWYANVYNQASQATGGVSESICGNFDLSAIGKSVTADDGSRDLACDPKAGTLQVTETSASGSALSIGYSVVTSSTGGYRLQFSSALPANTTVHVAFTCQ